MYPKAVKIFISPRENILYSVEGRRTRVANNGTGLEYKDITYYLESHAKEMHTYKATKQINKSCLQNF